MRIMLVDAHIEFNHPLGFTSMVELDSFHGDFVGRFGNYTGVYQGGLNGYKSIRGICNWMFFYRRGTDDILPNLSNLTSDERLEIVLGDIEYTFGLVDNPEQIIKHHQSLVLSSDKYFIIWLTPIYVQDMESGWYYDYGKYIGEHNLSTLDLEVIYNYHIIQVESEHESNI